ncbi:hypothetical protein DY218_19540 [Streptomyces triticagri]|uniref:Uncharacterized protein n=1 Tax=Streptomyces triticagri TaxID=2293568 RepID=A0A372M275_9ACTN|nr:hypothetical protein [Streptomyces triticagri]RFU85028.1 hypothetical protein DY218_19540 [Streptomyces triticagri]
MRDAGGAVLGMRHLGGAELPRDGWTQFALPVIELARGRKYAIEVEQVAGGKAAYEFPVNGDGLLLRTGLDMHRERDRSLILQWYRDAADAIADIREETGDRDARAVRLLDRAERALAGHRPREAYELAIKADTLRFPVLYQVHAGRRGGFEPFPLDADADVDADVDLTAHDAGHGLEFQVYGYGSGRVDFTVRGLGTRPEVTVDGRPVPTRPRPSGATFCVELTGGDGGQRGDGHTVRIRN